jgi:hypothetical protein
VDDGLLQPFLGRRSDDVNDRADDVDCDRELSGDMEPAMPALELSY